MCVFAVNLTGHHNWKLNTIFLLQTLLDLSCRTGALVIKLVARKSDYLQALVSELRIDFVQLSKVCLWKLSLCCDINKNEDFFVLL